MKQLNYLNWLFLIASLAIWVAGMFLHKDTALLSSLFITLTVIVRGLMIDRLKSQIKEISGKQTSVNVSADPINITR